MEKAKKGFAAMDRALVSQIASKGGKAAHERGTAHKFNTEEAKAAGRKGGLAARAKRKEALVFDEVDAALTPDGIER